jgi:hypothetical protein
MDSEYVAEQILDLFFPYTENPHGNKNTREPNMYGSELLFVLRRELKKLDEEYPL